MSERPEGYQVDRVGLTNSARRKAATLIGELAYKYRVTVKEAALLVASLVAESETRQRAAGCLQAREERW